MKITLKKKTEMCEEHVIKGKSLSHVSEMYVSITFKFYT